MVSTGSLNQAAHAEAVTGLVKTCGKQSTAKNNTVAFPTRNMVEAPLALAA